MDLVANVESNWSITSPVNLRRTIVLGVTDTPAAATVLEICRGLDRFSDVIVVCTKGSLTFFDRPTVAREFLLYCEEDYQQQLPVDLAAWADIFIVAPCSGSCLSKLSLGLNDDLLSSVACVWPYNFNTMDNNLQLFKPMMVIVDMHPSMMINKFDHAIALISKGVDVDINPAPYGRMRPAADVVANVQQKFHF